MKKLVSPATKCLADVSDSHQLQPQKEQDPTALRRRTLNEARQPNPSIASPTDHHGDTKTSPTKRTWVDAAARHPNSPIPTLTTRKTGEKIRFAPPSAALADNQKVSRVEGDSSCRAQISTPPTANYGASLARTTAAPTPLTDNPGDITRKHTVDATLHTVPPTLPTAKHRVRTNFPPAPFTMSPADNSVDGTREIRRKDNPTSPPTSPPDNPGDARHHSAHFRLHGPGLLDVTLVPEQQAQLPASTHPPPSTVIRAP